MSGHLILASGSPRRRDILSAAGIPFEAIPSLVEERLLPGESSEDHVRRLAAAKAGEVAARAPDSAFVLGADTVVEIDGKILGKPVSATEAEEMLRLLSGRSHRVITGLCLLGPAGVQRQDTVNTAVLFRRLTDEEIEEYVHSGEPMDKAGAYAIQGLAGKFVERVEGCYFNVMGLPVATVYRLLKESGWKASSVRLPERSALS